LQNEKNKGVASKATLLSYSAFELHVTHAFGLHVIIKARFWVTCNYFNRPWRPRQTADDSKHLVPGRQAKSVHTNQSIVTCVRDGWQFDWEHDRRRQIEIPACLLLRRFISAQLYLRDFNHLTASCSKRLNRLQLRRRNIWMALQCY